MSEGVKRGGIFFIYHSRARQSPTIKLIKRKHIKRSAFSRLKILQDEHRNAENRYTSSSNYSRILSIEIIRRCCTLRNTKSKHARTTFFKMAIYYFETITSFKAVVITPTAECKLFV